MAGLTDEQQEMLATIEARLKEKGVTMTAAQKAILISKGSSVMGIMAGGPSKSEPVPDPMKVQPGFPKEVQNAPKQKDETIDYGQKGTVEEGVRKLKEQAQKEEESLKN